MIAENEASWRDTELANREIETRVAAFLTPGQLAQLSAYHAQQREGLRRRIEAMRAQAGLDPTIPARPASASEDSKPRRAVDQQVQIEIQLTVNRAEPTLVTRTVRNGESFTFDTAEGLTVEATPRLYEDHWLDLQMAYFEQEAAGKRRRLPGGASFGIPTRSSEGPPFGGGGSVLQGRQGYAINARIRATVL